MGEAGHVPRPLPKDSTLSGRDIKLNEGDALQYFTAMMRPSDSKTT